MSTESIKLAKDLLAKHASSDFGGMKIVPEYIAQEAVEVAGEVPDLTDLYNVAKENVKKYIDDNQVYYISYGNMKMLEKLAALGIIKLTK